MKPVLARLASLKISVVLLLLLLVGLAAGTILESSQGTDAAGRLVYYAWWFLALQGAFALNVIAAIALHFPWGKTRAGFFTTHTALIVILAGATTTYFCKQEGQLELWEGESSSTIAKGLDLPFAVKLDSFRIDRYPGTMRPANFTSDVQVTDPGKAPFKASIWMNHVLEHRGWRLYQSSYKIEGSRSATVLSVSKDPGQAIVFFGYGLLVFGMCVVLATRIAQSRAKAARESEIAESPKSGGKRKVAAAAAVALLAVGGAAHAEDAYAAIRRLPVQHDGRAMPLDTLAREAVWQVTGSRSWDEVPMVLQWTFDAKTAANTPVVNIGSTELATAAGLPGKTHASFVELVNDKPLMDLLQRAHELAEQERPRQGAMAAAEKLEERLLTLQRFLQREEIRAIPAADPKGKWDVAGAGTADELAALANGPRLTGWPSTAEIDREILYNQLRPTRLAWIVLAAALVLSIFAWNGKRRWLDALSLTGLVAGFAVMTWGIVTRWQIAGRIPAANMYESLLFLAWGVGLFAVVAFAVMRNRLVVLNANAMAALTMALTDLLPIDGFVHPVPPVLSGTPWLAIHVPIIMVSYSVLALGLVIAHMQIGFTIFAPKRVDLIQRMNDLLYWYMHVGSILLIAGILTGSIWASSSWGRYWGWDPKEVWSLVAFLAYMAIFHARWDKQIGRFGVAAVSIVAFQTILMTYLGVNFVLTTGMHSYGMGDSPVVTWMVITATAEAGFLLWGLLAQRRGDADLRAATA